VKRSVKDLVTIVKSQCGGYTSGPGYVAYMAALDVERDERVSAIPTMEFCLVWMEHGPKWKGEWIVLLQDGSTLSASFGAVGYALNAALEKLGRGESDYSCVEDTSTFYRYVLEDPEF